MTVGSVAVGTFVAPPPLAVALLVTLLAAFAATLTVSASGFAWPPAGIAAGYVHVTTCADGVQVHPFPPPDA